jgi:hypothetical protein
MMRRIIVAAAVTVVAAALAPAAGASSWGPDSNSCTGTLEDPHYSTGARGVIVKSHFMCTEGGRDIINHMTALFWVRHHAAHQRRGVAHDELCKGRHKHHGALQPARLRLEDALRPAGGTPQRGVRRLVHGMPASHLEAVLPGGQPPYLLDARLLA